ncbi:MAG: Gfo/Idh/MocA family oxidoreductase [Chloroflexota bacterium]
MKKVRVGVVNTGWWADAMYLPALTAHESVAVTAVCGRNPQKAKAFSQSWSIPNFFADYRAMLNSGLCDAVIVASTTDTHYEITMAALEKGLHVLCEKPLARSVQEAEEMTAFANAEGLKTMVPFTYRYMPHNRFMKQLIEDGFIGQPYHLNIRYYHDFGRNEGYGWGWDSDLVGAGDVANLGSHPIYLALWYFGDVETVTAELNQTISRGETTPSGAPMKPADDNGVLTLRFKNGAMGTIHYSSLSYETTSAFKQQHYYEFQGSKGTLYHKNNWYDVQETIGATEGEALRPLNPPDDIWGAANIPNNVHESYKVVFRQDKLMVGEFIDAILNDTAVTPSFADGLAVQKIIEAAISSSDQGRRIKI